MSHQQPNSSSEAVPSWDEFNVGNDAEEELDYDEDTDPPPEAAQDPGEFGPSLPPGFNENSRDAPSSSNQSNGDFAIPLENDDDPDDPEDPQDPHHSGRRNIGPTLPTALNPSASRREDAFVLPSITSTSDFEPRASSPAVASSSRQIGPSLPPELFPDQSDAVSNSKSVDNGFSLPPDEPQNSAAPASSRAVAPAKNGRAEEGFGYTGPSLPAELLPSVSSSTEANRVKQNGNASTSASAVIGPSLPPDLYPDSTHFNDYDGVVDEPSSPAPGPSWQEAEEPGPSAPSSSTSSQRVVGPALPPNFQMELPIEDEEEEAAGRNGVKDKPAENDDEEDLVGPMPPPPPEKSAEEEAEYFRRLMEFEAKQAENSSLKREEWMTELPKKMKANYGLSARTFSRSNAPSSSGGAAAWTATPNGKQKAGPSKPEPEEILAAKRNAERDRAEELKAAALNEGRQESLMEQHKRKRKGDNDDGAAPSGVLVGGRRTFNRDSDMEVRGLSVSAEEVKKRMGTLNNRFGHGSSQKFL